MSVSSTNATPNAKENSSNEKGASVPADGDESGEEIEKERNLDCKDDDDIDTDREDEDIKGGNETKRPGNPRSISIDEAEKAVKAAMNSYKHTASNENKKEFFRKFHNYLVSKRYEAAMSELEELTRDFNATSDKLKDLKVPVKVEILREAQIVAMTTTKAAIEHKLLNMLQPQIIVMEEGGGVLEPNLLACIPPSTKHLIVIGDHKQIGPTVVSEELQKELKFGVSLLERLVDPNRRRLECNVEQGSFPHVTLNTQCRMNSELLDLFQTDYGEGFKLRTRKVGHQDFQPPACMKGCKVWWSYEKGSLEQKRQGKVFNPTEARMVASYSYWLFSEGFDAEEVALLTPYSAQVSEIKDAINTICLNARVSKDHVKHFESFQGRVFTVDSFQGHECDIVILSLVRNNNQSKIGFLSDETRQVVALSRQRRALCIIACEEHMSKSPSWRKRRKAFNFGDKDLQKLTFGEDEVSTPDKLNQRVTKQLACGRRKKKQYLPLTPDVYVQQQSTEENDQPVQEEHYAIPLTTSTTMELQCIAEVVGADWKGVMRKVAGMTQNDIKKICANERDVIEQGVYALNKWVENSSKGCTLGQILRVLPKGQQKEIISKIEKIRTSSYSR
jgi:superfamily I DNA and/or RNA helicase